MPRKKSTCWTKQTGLDFGFVTLEPEGTRLWRRVAASPEPTGPDWGPLWPMGAKCTLDGQFAWVSAGWLLAFECCGPVSPHHGFIWFGRGYRGYRIRRTDGRAFGPYSSYEAAIAGLAGAPPDLTDPRQKGGPRPPRTGRMCPTCGKRMRKGA